MAVDAANLRLERERERERERRIENRNVRRESHIEKINKLINNGLNGV